MSPKKINPYVNPYANPYAKTKKKHNNNNNKLQTSVKSQNATMDDDKRTVGALLKNTQATTRGTTTTTIKTTKKTSWNESQPRIPAVTPPTKTRPVVTTTRANKKQSNNNNFKAQLKQQIQQLKRQKKQEAARKAFEAKKAERERIRQQQWQERQRLVEEELQRKQAEKQRRTEERRLREQAERQQKQQERQAKALERQKREAEKEERRLDKERQRQADYQQKLRVYEQQQQAYTVYMQAMRNRGLSLGVPAAHYVPYGHSHSPPAPNAAPPPTLIAPAVGPSSCPTEATRTISMQGAGPITNVGMVPSMGHPPPTEALAPAPKSASIQPLPIFPAMWAPGQSGFWPGSYMPQYYIPKPPLPPPPPPLPKPRKPRAPKAKSPQNLTAKPLEDPSPFVHTHELLPSPIVIFKNPGASFGVGLVCERQSTLLDPDLAHQLLHGSGKSTLPLAQQTCTGASRNTGNSSNPPQHAAESKIKADSALVPQMPVGETSLPNAKEDHLQDAATLAVDKPQQQPPLPEKALVASPNKLALAASQPNPPPTTIKTRRRRRRRVEFAALAVVSAAKQNESHPQSDSRQQLRARDLILSINGQSVGGKSFAEACALFANDAQMRNRYNATESEKQQEQTLQCELVVARLKEKPPQPVAPAKENKDSIPLAGPKRVRLVVNAKTNSVVSGDFSDQELEGLATMMVSTLCHNSRLLGSNPTDEVQQGCRPISLQHREFVCIAKKWRQLCSIFEVEMAMQADLYWKKQWEHETRGKMSLPPTIKLDYLTPSLRSALRCLPRPAKGCRCGSNDHEYVHHPKCLLYHDLCQLLGPRAALPSENKETKLNIPKGLNAVETAIKDRIVKLSKEKANQQSEAKFVADMEDLQLAKTKMAIFAPSFTAIVISAVAKVAEDFETASGSENVETKDPKSTNPNLGDFEQEAEHEDDIPLSAIGKRHGAEDDTTRPSKKPKKSEFDLEFSPLFCARLLLFIGETWGHLHAEPSHEDHAWRWEVYHAQYSDESARNPGSARSPRVPGSLSFEKIQFAVDDGLISRLSTGLNVMDLLRIVYLVSPQRTGLFDELVALHRAGILAKTKKGGAVLTEDWVQRADPVLLDDMHLRWHVGEDVLNKFRVHPRVRRDLANYWLRLDEGWALNEDISDVVYSNDEWSLWRRNFQAQIEHQADNNDGIGNFGI